MNIIVNSDGENCLNEIKETFKDTFYKQVSKIAISHSDNTEWKNLD
jgi:hypothetical protein